MDEEFEDDEGEARSEAIIEKLNTKMVTKESTNMCAICLKTYRKGEQLF